MCIFTNVHLGMCLFTCVYTLWETQSALMIEKRERAECNVQCDRHFYK